MFTKRTITYFISVMLLVSSLLMIVADNVPILASFRWLWGPALLVFTLLARPKLYLNKMAMSVMLFGLFYCVILQYWLWPYANDWYKRKVFEDFYAMFAGVLFFLNLRSCNDIRMWHKLAKLGLLFFVITGIMTIVATEINPLLVRASYSSLKESIAGFDKLKRLGFGSYGYMAAVLAIFPTLVYYYKHSSKWKKKVALIFLILFFYFVLIRAQIFANMLVGAIIIIFAFLGLKRIRQSILLISLVLVMAFIIPKQVYANFLFTISQYFDADSENYLKVTDMAQFISNTGNQRGTPETRLNRYPVLYNAFTAQPLLGDASYNSKYDYEMATGGHLYWMSLLALWGIFGFIGYLLILTNVFKPVFAILNKEFKFYYTLSVLAVFIMGFMKLLSGREIFIVLLIIVPGLYFSIVLQEAKKE